MHNLDKMLWRCNRLQTHIIRIEHDYFLEVQTQQLKKLEMKKDLTLN